MDTRHQPKFLKGHETNVSVVKLSTASSKVCSGSLDGCVFVWDWKDTELPSLISKGRKDAVTVLSLSSDDSKLFLGSQDGSVKMWDSIAENCVTILHLPLPLEVLRPARKRKCLQSAHSINVCDL